MEHHNPVWRIIRVLTGREGAISRTLVESGIPSYSPQETRRIRVTASKANPDGIRRVGTALLPGYVFVLCDADELSTVRATDGVLPFFAPTLPGISRSLSRAENRIVVTLMATEIANLFDRSIQEHSFREGQRVKVILARYEGGDLDVIAKVIKAESTSERIRVLMDCFGAERETDISVDRVIAI